MICNNKASGCSKPPLARKGFPKEVLDHLNLCAKFRRDGLLIPKGVYKFKTFEEENAWTLKMLARKRRK